MSRRVPVPCTYTPVRTIVSAATAQPVLFVKVQNNPTYGVTVLGDQLNPALCERCGAIVGDTIKHTEFHQKIGY